jgi:hypothetical protein
MGKKKLAALAVILISALVLTVYALRVSNVLEVYWSVYESAALPDGCIKIKYWEVLDNQWHDLPLSRADANTFEGWFGPADGFDVPPGYDVTSYFLVLFEANAPVASYGFQAWAEQM